MDRLVRVVDPGRVEERNGVRPEDFPRFIAMEGLASLFDTAVDYIFCRFQLGREILDDHFRGFLEKLQVVIITIHVHEAFYRLFRGIVGRYSVVIDKIDFIEDGFLAEPGGKQGDHRMTSGGGNDRFGNLYHVDAGEGDTDHHDAVDIVVLQAILDGHLVVGRRSIGQQVERVMQLPLDGQPGADFCQGFWGRCRQHAAHSLQGIDGHLRRGDAIGDDHQSFAFGSVLLGGRLNHIEKIDDAVDSDAAGPFKHGFIDQILFCQRLGAGDGLHGEVAGLARFDDHDELGPGEVANCGHESAAIVDGPQEEENRPGAAIPA
ncbi:MAG: hypothetical protein ACD_75C02435G0002 [uncultured bacterium]|nr:MAG: hypothetical protein ACD_75C02435G0002 [uncultured bacterium]